MAVSAHGSVFHLIRISWLHLWRSPPTQIIVRISTYKSSLLTRAIANRTPPVIKIRTGVTLPWRLTCTLVWSGSVCLNIYRIVQNRETYERALRANVGDNFNTISVLLKGHGEEREEYWLRRRPRWWALCKRSFGSLLRIDGRPTKYSRLIYFRNIVLRLSFSPKFLLLLLT